MLTDRCRWHCNCTQAGIEDESIDVATSNCVINLSPAKPQVIQGVYDALKWGGEFYFSDIYASRRLPTAVQQHEGALPPGCCCAASAVRRANLTHRCAWSPTCSVLWGECLAGALCTCTRCWSVRLARPGAVTP